MNPQSGLSNHDSTRPQSDGEDGPDVSQPLLNPHDNSVSSHSQSKPEDGSNTSHPKSDETTTSQAQYSPVDNGNESDDQRPGLHSRVESDSSLSMVPLDIARPRYPRLMSQSSTSNAPFARHHRTDSTASSADFSFRRHNRFESTASVFSMSSYRHSRVDSTTSTTHLIWDAETNSVAGLESRYSMASDVPYNRASTDLDGIQLYSEWSQKEEPDDELHIPEDMQQPFICFSIRGFFNMGMVIILFAGLAMLFFGWPLYLGITKRQSQAPGFNLGGINATGQIPDITNFPTLVDKDTPQEAMTHVGTDGITYELVFSDEFETSGRTFYPGDDPYWEALDLYYASTGDLEKYDPAAITTEDGKLVITLSLKQWENLNFQSGMLTSWNKFCFTTGYLEVSLSLPDSATVPGLWPAAWTMGNLGRPGYRATTDGVWPYSYDTCDLGTFPNQTDRNGNPQSSAGLSYLPGQRLSSCTCPGSDHPGPTTSDGRSAPEIDMFEAQVDNNLRKAEVSQSYQLGPFDNAYSYNNAPPATTVENSNITFFNSFKGNVYQEAVSAVTLLNGTYFNGTAYTTYGFEYWSNPQNRGEGYITWFSQGTQSWKVTADSFLANNISMVGDRLVSEEPMAIIMNLAMSYNFEAPDLHNLQFPAKMYVDYVRLYQRPGLEEAIGCDPSQHPTAEYIANHPEAYNNYNKTTWADAGYGKPLNSLYDGC